MFHVPLENIHLFYGFSMTVENTFHRKMDFTLLNYFDISSLGFTVSLKNKPNLIILVFNIVIERQDPDPIYIQSKRD